MTERKFLLFIVEGDHDKGELSAILHLPRFSYLLEKYEIAIVPQNNDLTATKGTSASNIQAKIQEAVMKFRRNGSMYGFYNNIPVDDIQEVIQITDTDGAFIDPNRIVRGEDCDFVYEDDQITTTNVAGAVGRNKRKSSILIKLSQVPMVANIKYSIYYVSCNMDHLLFNERNATRGQKGKNERAFQLLCEKAPDILNYSIFDKRVMVNCSYDDSWEFIQKDCNSLQRHTNLNLFLSDRAKNAK